MFKNVKTDEMKAIVRVKDRRDFEGKATEFWVRDRLVPQVKIDRFKARVRRTGHTPAGDTLCPLCCDSVLTGNRSHAVKCLVFHASKWAIF